MKKIYWSLLLCLALLVATPVAAAPNIGFEAGGLAQKIGGNAGYDTSAGETALSTTIGKIIRALLSLSGTLFLALTVYGGVRWMSSQGEEAEIEKGKEIIKAALIGLTISMAAYAITIFVVDKITQSTVANQVGGSACSAECITAGQAAGSGYILIPEGNAGCVAGSVCARKSEVKGKSEAK